ncbi:hypothetical protein ACV229_17560 [Burkholderia sp. MR1-5-21]
MTEKHSPIAGFRIARPAARRGRTMSEHRPVLRSEVRQLIEELVANELRQSLASVMRTSAVEPVARPASEPAPQPPRKVFNVGRIDPAKCKLPIFSDAEAEAMARRETLMHFGQNPDL